MHAQCDNFIIFACEILCGINLENSRIFKNCHFLQVQSLWILFLANFNPQKWLKIIKNPTLEPQKYQNGNSWNLCNHQKLVSRKIWQQNNVDIFTQLIEFPGFWATLESGRVPDISGNRSNSVFCVKLRCQFLFWLIFSWCNQAARKWRNAQWSEPLITQHCSDYAWHQS